MRPRVHKEMAKLTICASREKAATPDRQTVPGVVEFQLEQVTV